MTSALMIAVLFVTSVAVTDAAAKELRVLANHRLRFDNGPELNNAQFRVELERMKRNGDCPDVHLAPDKSISFTVVESVMRDFERLSGCSRIGWTGEEKYAP